MSWRTQGHYRGMGAAEKEWLRDFDRNWDLKQGGRSQVDALDHAGGDKAPEQATRPKREHAFKYADIADPTTGEVNARVALEAMIIRASGHVARFTVPRQTKAGWSIHLITKCGQRIRAKFDDMAAATQAYEALEELSLWFTKG